MLKLIFAAFKYGVFALAVIILSNWIKVDGVTVSELVRSQMNGDDPIAQAPKKAIKWGETLFKDVGTSAKALQEIQEDSARAAAAAKDPNKKNQPKKPIDAARSDDDTEELISERQKLKGVLEKLNAANPLLKRTSESN